jgi:hypothetical protein
MGGEPMMEEPMGSEPMMEEPMGGEPMMEERNNSSFMNNEFRTINTAPQSQKPMQRTQDDDGVFFPDAAESRQKNIMYK